MHFSYSTRNPDVPVAYSRLNAMHTECEIMLPLCPEEKARELIRGVWEKVREAERRYNRFSEDSLLTVINKEAGERELELDDEMFMVLQLCRTFRAATCGYFDISVGSHSSLRPASRFSTQPGPQGLRDWILDPQKRTVRFSGQGMSLDLGGFVKGFALQQTAQDLTGIGCGLVSFGGSSIIAIGHHPLGRDWPVSTGHIYYADRVAHTFHLADTSLSISGKDRHGRGHIVDPITGSLVGKDGLVAVQGRSAMVTEVLSTALWVAPNEKRKDILASFKGYDAWEILCLPDGEARVLKI